MIHENNLGIIIRPMKIDDLEEVLYIENTSFISPWDKKQFVYEINENPVSKVWVLILKNNDISMIVGYIDFWITFDSACISKIAIHSEFHRKRLGATLFNEMIDECIKNEVASITLEVRKSNSSAIHFYVAQGFHIVLCKEKYYSNGEDAFYMIKELNNG